MKNFLLATTAVAFLLGNTAMVIATENPKCNPFRGFFGEWHYPDECGLRWSGDKLIKITPTPTEKPDEPGKPGKPDKPSKPDKPNRPDKPNKPDHPNKPDKPSKPDKPDRPHDDNGHGNDDDHDDDSNPGKGGGNHGTKDRTDRDGKNKKD